MNNRLLLLTIWHILFINLSISQTSEGISKSIKIYMNKTTGLPANIVVDKQQFSEPSGNGFLDAEETGTLTINLKNTGSGDAFGLQIKITPQTDINGVTYTAPSSIPVLAAGKTETVRITFTANQSVTSKKIKLKIDVNEANGFDLEPSASVAFETRSLIPPELIVADVGINDQSGNGQIEPREIVEVTARIQNKSQGDARDVKAYVKLGENVFMTPDSKTEFSLGNLQAGTYHDIVFSIFTNTQATGVPTNIEIKEARGRYDKNLPLNLAFNKPQKRATELVVVGKETTPKVIADVATLSVDVDVNIPKLKATNPNAFAVILGIERYKSIDNVTYAKRDASVFKEYAANVLGVPDDKNHLYFKTDDDVTKGEFEKLFTENGWLAKRVQPTSDIFIYYAGHGAPDVKEKSPYLIPYDGDPNYPTQTGFKLNKLYEELAKLNVRSITVFLDACFSGSTRENKMLLAGARPVTITIENPLFLSEKIVAFTASSGGQISSGYPEKKHGLFTYYLLKGLRGDADLNGDKTVAVDEMEKYLLDNVPKTAGQLDREQTPQVFGRDKQRVLVKY